MSEVDDLILISVDDHIIEPPDLFVNHLPAKYQERAPKLVRNDEGNDVWTFGKVVMETAALNAVAGRPKEEYGLEPQSLDEVRPGCYDVARAGEGHGCRRRPRLHELPELPTFTARTFLQRRSRPSLALVRAYNDWHMDEWCAAYPARFIPMAVPAIWDARRPRTRSVGSRQRAAIRSASRRTPPRSGTRASTTSTGTRCGGRAATRARCSPSTWARPDDSPSPPSTRRRT